MVDWRYTAHQLRFAFLLLLEQDAQPITLYKRFEVNLMKDYLDRGLGPEAAQLQLRKALRASWLALGNDAEHFHLNQLGPCADELPESAKSPPALSDQRLPRLGQLIAGDAAQQKVVDDVMSSTAADADQFLFVQGRAGSGKSTIATYITETLSLQGLDVVNVATTGIAALQLPHCCTAHSFFKIPLEDDEHLCCGLSMHSHAAQRFARAAVLQWDDWPNMKRVAWESVLRFLDDLRSHQAAIYRQKTIVCYGDFRQIAPVVRGGGREAIVAMSVRRSSSWGHFRVHELTTSHRQERDPGYAAWIETIGLGTAPSNHAVDGRTGYVSLDFCDCVPTSQDAIAFCFPALNDAHNCSQAKILAATNALVDEYNDLVLTELTQVYKLPEHVRLSADSLDMDSGEQHVEEHISNEFLNMQTEHGVPPHRLRMVPGALYELMRNFSPEDGLMNHCPVILREVHDHHVLIETLRGHRFPMPRICFRWQLRRSMSTMVRRQFPLRPCYSSTFNGAQSCTLQRVVVDVSVSPFAHGHLYVALGRVRARSDIRVRCQPARVSEASKALAKNIVWPELLLPKTSVPPGPAATHGARALRKRPAAAVAANARKRR